MTKCECGEEERDGEQVLRSARPCDEARKRRQRRIEEPRVHAGGATPDVPHEQDKENRGDHDEQEIQGMGENRPRRAEGNEHQEVDALRDRAVERRPGRVLEGRDGARLGASEK
jgi:hypothetical protein